ncbi:MAG: Cof-type HAD-IIB family hydrolase [Treponema sp.]|jgi:Cof subfamily protein (haloacid dehalogenase superfamily)|nr:Cof-type HAD-IIB family hydrolase [Treponema sp.]
MMDIKVGPGDIKALALDLDGTTLMPGAVLGDRTLYTLKALRTKGIEIILCTGRAVEAAERFRLPIGAEGPMVYFNGAEVTEMPSGRVLDATLLDAEAVNFCVDISRRLGLYYQVFLPPRGDAPDGASPADKYRRVLMAEKWGPGAEMYLNHTGIKAEIGDLKEALTLPGVSGCIKSMFIAEPEVQDKVRPLIEERFGRGIYIARTLRTFLEIMNSRVSKGRGLRVALETRGLEPSQVMAFGDEENDLPLFEGAAYSVAPSNAKETVRQAADITIGSNAEESVAAFLEEFFGLH